MFEHGMRHDLWDGVRHAERVEGFDGFCIGFRVEA